MSHYRGTEPAVSPPPVADVAALKAIADRTDKQMILLEDVGKSYRFDLESAAAGDDDNVIVPTAGSGRWLKYVDEALQFTAAEKAAALAVPAAATIVVDGDFTPAYSMLRADVDSTPTALTVGASTIVGRAAAGGIVALSAAQVRTIAGQALDNLGAAVPPDPATDDNTAGYGIGSLWLDTTANLLHVCLDPSTGAAVWLPANAPTPLASVPDANDDETDGFMAGSLVLGGSGGGLYICTDATATSATWERLNATTAIVAPGSNDDILLGYVRGSLWYDAVLGKLHVCTLNTATSATWAEVNIAGSVTAKSVLVDITNYMEDAGTWTEDISSGCLEELVHTPAAAAESAWFRVLGVGLGDLPTGVVASYEAGTAVADDIRFELWKVTTPADGAARTAAVLCGQLDAHYDAAHNTAAKRGDIVGAPELHRIEMTNPSPAALTADETLRVRVYIDGDAVPSNTFKLTSAVVLYNRSN